MNTHYVGLTSEDDAIDDMLIDRNGMYGTMAEQEFQSYLRSATYRDYITMYSLVSMREEADSDYKLAKLRIRAAQLSK